jgi:hypothetical protein
MPTPTKESYAFDLYSYKGDKTQKQSFTDLEELIGKLQRDMATLPLTLLMALLRGKRKGKAVPKPAPRICM